VATTGLEEFLIGSSLTRCIVRVIVDPSGVREGGANPPLPRNCKR
jgi:hypothetical protein